MVAFVGFGAMLSCIAVTAYATADARQAVNLASGQYVIWPEAQVPFYFGADAATMPTDMRNRVREAVGIVNSRTTVKTFEVTGPLSYCGSTTCSTQTSLSEATAAYENRPGWTVHSSCDLSSASASSDTACRVTCTKNAQCRAATYSSGTCKLSKCMSPLVSATGSSLFIRLPSFPLEVKHHNVDEHLCYTYLGYQGKSAQQRASYNHVMLSSQCPTGSIVHEFMHSLGFYHEHTRSDRDSYVVINWQNIPTDANTVHQFEKADTVNVAAYDYGSVMHYCGYCGSTGSGPAITAKDASKQNVMGQRTGMSDSDVLAITALYSATACPKPTSVLGSLVGTNIATGSTGAGTTAFGCRSAAQATAEWSATWTAPASTDYVFSSAGSGFTTYMQVVDGQCRASTSKCGDSSVVVSAKKGDKFFVIVAGAASGQSGAVKLSITDASGAPPPPTGAPLAPPPVPVAVPVKPPTAPPPVIAPQPPPISPAPPPTSSSYGACTYSGQTGTCLDKTVSTCTGTWYAGVCPGSSTVQCCVAATSSTGSSFTAADVQAVVDHHNQVRTAACGGMAPLKWNANLAAFAQKWANSMCASGTMQHSTSTQRTNVGGFSYIGENLAMGTGVTGLKASQMWAGEKPYWTGPAFPGTCAAGQQCGHYTQQIWADTTEVGCGRCQQSGTTSYYVSCNYGEGGNYMGENVYNAASCGTSAPVSPPVAPPVAVPVAPPPVAAPVGVPVAAPKAPVSPPVSPPVAVPVAAPKAVPVAAPKAVPVAVPKAPVAVPVKGPVGTPVYAPYYTPSSPAVAQGYKCPSGYSDSPADFPGCEEYAGCDTDAAGNYVGPCSSCVQLTGTSCSIVDSRVNAYDCNPGYTRSTGAVTKCATYCGCTGSKCSYCCKQSVVYTSVSCSRMTPYVAGARRQDVAAESTTVDATVGELLTLGAPQSTDVKTPLSVGIVTGYGVGQFVKVEAAAIYASVHAYGSGVYSTCPLVESGMDVNWGMCGDVATRMRSAPLAVESGLPSTPLGVSVGFVGATANVASVQVGAVSLKEFAWSPAKSATDFAYGAYTLVLDQATGASITLVAKVNCDGQTRLTAVCPAPSAPVCAAAPLISNGDASGCVNVAAGQVCTAVKCASDAWVLQGELRCGFAGIWVNTPVCVDADDCASNPCGSKTCFNVVGASHHCEDMSSGSKLTVEALGAIGYPAGGRPISAEIQLTVPLVAAGGDGKQQMSTKVGTTCAAPSGMWGEACASNTFETFVPANQDHHSISISIALSGGAPAVARMLLSEFDLVAPGVLLGTVTLPRAGGVAVRVTLTEAGCATNAALCGFAFPKNLPACALKAYSAEGALAPGLTVLCAKSLDTLPAYGACGNVTCSQGYRAHGELRCGGDGTYVNVPQCVDIDECADNSNGCDANAKCANTVGGYTCTCNAGFLDMGSGYKCVPQPQEFVSASLCSSPCSAVGSTCTALPDGTFGCRCTSGYTGDGTTCFPLAPHEDQQTCASTFPPAAVIAAAAGASVAVAFAVIGWVLFGLSLAYFKRKELMYVAALVRQRGAAKGTADAAAAAVGIRSRGVEKGLAMDAVPARFRGGLDESLMGTGDADAAALFAENERLRNEVAALRTQAK